MTIVNGGAGIEYTAGSVGTETFTYTISDGHGGTDTETVTVTVEAASPGTVIEGTQQSDSWQDLQGTSGDETFHAYGGNDQIRGRGGNDVYDGGSGYDTAILEGSAEDYEMTSNGDGSYNLMHPSGTSLLIGIEAIYTNGGGEWMSIEDAYGLLRTD